MYDIKQTIKQTINLIQITWQNLKLVMQSITEHILDNITFWLLLT